MTMCAFFASGCDGWREPDAPSPYVDQGISTQDIPHAYRAPIGLMSAIGRNGLIEDLPTCEGFSIGGLSDARDWRAFQRDVNARLGERAGVLTDISAFDAKAHRISVTSRPIGGGASPLETEWTVRTKADDDSAHGAEHVLDCIESVFLKDLTQ
ncbi:hypothetical protein KCG44_07725 [Pacificimonas sp. WHA3]|uniref:Lipoprotein n=1 Tax=Pacificimonas pallii TaxID=2827236 RepID=A0ABS6SE27_9SPHN|nr:hypothetical protein [Pacificimonas pallii]MBV7256672.1 hypothetical protein [Pacificimonas pallii]